MKKALIGLVVPIIILTAASTGFAQLITFDEHIVSSSFRMASSTFAIDIDDDGDTDILAASYLYDDIAWWENDGSQNFSQHIIDGDFDGAFDVIAVDIDDDGDIDVLGAARLANDIAWWENDGSEGFTKHPIDENFNFATSVVAADIDDDGDIDVLAAARSDDDIAWWENDGSENFAKHTIAVNFDGVNDVVAVDLDDDGDMDVLGCALVHDDIAWWENDGSENFSKHIIAGNFDCVICIHAEDIDDDGDMDVLGAAYNDDDITWWENDGSESFTEHTISGDFDGANGVISADFDDDGDVDVVGVARYTDEVAWWENDGSENFTKHTIDNDFEDAFSVNTGDIDSDGFTDILGAGYYGDIVSWWENKSYQSPYPYSVTIWSEIDTGSDLVLVDEGNAAALDSSATDSLDSGMDVPEPQHPANNYLSTYFPHPEWNYILGDNFMVDIRNANDDLTNDVKVYSFEVTTDMVGETVELVFYIQRLLYPDYGVVLYDSTTGGYQNLRENHFYNFTAGAGERGFDLRLGDGTGPEIDITFPTSDTVLYFNTTYTVTWDYTDSTACRYSKVYYSLDDGANWTFIDSVSGSTQSCSWTTPSNYSALAKIKVQSKDWAGNSGTGETGYNFTISLGYLNAVTIRSEIDTGADEVYLDDGNIAALDTGATDVYDSGMDIPEPAPPANDYLSTYFPHSEWGSIVGDNFMVDVRNGNDDLTNAVKVYKFYVETDLVGDTVDLTFNLGSEYSQDYGVVLYDSIGGNYQNLRDDNQYSFTASASVRSFDLRLGDGTNPDIDITFPTSDTTLYYGMTYNIEWTNTDVSPIRYTNLYYSLDNGSNWTQIDSLTDGLDGSYSWNVPYATSDSVKLKIEAEDWAGNFTSEVTAYTFAIDIIGQLEHYFAEGWHLMSIPLIPEYTHIDSLFGDNFTSAYFFYDYSQVSGYGLVYEVEHGKGYWLVTEDSATVDVSGDPVQDSTVMVLNPGWFISALPLPIPKPATSLKFTDGDSIYPYSQAIDSGWVGAAFYNYDNTSGSYGVVDTLEPWFGYWLQVLQDSLQMIAYIEELDGSPDYKGIDDEDDWFVTIALTQGALSDNVGGIGANLQATDGYDVWYDLALPPTPPSGNYVRAVFEHPEWGAPVGERFCRDVRAQLEPEVEKTWEFIIEASDPGEVTVDFENIANLLPPGYTAAAIHAGGTVDLLENSSFTFDYTAPYDIIITITNTNSFTVPLEISLSPVSLPIVIPAGGGSFEFDLSIENHDSGGITFDGWIMTLMPNGSHYGPLINRQNLFLPANGAINRNGMVQYVPAGAPVGIYSYEAYVGAYPDSVLDSDSFNFEKAAGLASPAHNFGWGLFGWDEEVILPSEYTLHRPYPNPFNPETKIAFGIPAAGDVSLRIYNIQGREVARLLDGWNPPGFYEVTFDASELPSGVYFARLTAGSFHQTRKLLLIK